MQTKKKKSWEKKNVDSGDGDDAKGKCADADEAKRKPVDVVTFDGSKALKLAAGADQSKNVDLIAPPKIDPARFDPVPNSIALRWRRRGLKEIEAAFLI